MLMREIRTTVRVRIFFGFPFFILSKETRLAQMKKKSVVISTTWPRSGMRDKLSASRGHATHDTTPAEQTGPHACPETGSCTGPFRSSPALPPIVTA